MSRFIGDGGEQPFGGSTITDCRDGSLKESSPARSIRKGAELTHHPQVVGDEVGLRDELATEPVHRDDGVCDVSAGRLDAAYGAEMGAGHRGMTPSG